MELRNRSRHDMLIRVRNFGATHRQLFPENSTAHAAFSIVATEVAQIEALAVAEHVASRAARAARKADARKQLVDFLVRAVHTARVLSRSIPELAQHAEAPVSVGDRPLLTFARGFATATAAHAAQFAAHGFAIEGLVLLIEAFEQAVSDRGTRRDELVQTRDRLDASLKRALQAVETLDVTVTNTLANDPVMLAAWKRDRHLRVRRLRAETSARTAPAESVAPVTPGVVEDTETKAA